MVDVEIGNTIQFQDNVYCEGYDEVIHNLIMGVVIVCCMNALMCLMNNTFYVTDFPYMYIWFEKSGLKM